MLLKLRTRHAAGRNSENEKGVALLELAITAPMLFMLALGVFDVSRLLITHMVLTQLVREGVRLGSREKNLEPGFFAYDCTENAATRVCYDAAYSSDCSFAENQQKVLGRVCRRLQDIPIRSNLAITADSLYITTYYDFLGDTIRYEIESDYEGFFGPFRGRRVTAQATGPYL